MKSIKVGDEILIEQAWEDETGIYHDEYAKVLEIDKGGFMKLDFGNEKLNKFLEGAEYNIKDYLKF